MKQRTPILDWEIDEADAVEEAVLLVQAVDSAPEVPLPRRFSPRFSRLLRGVMALIVLAVAILALVVWQRARENIIHIRGAIEGTIALEGRAWVAQDKELWQRLIDEDASPGWRARFERIETFYRRWSGENAQAPQVEIRDLELLGDVALVQAVITQTNATWAPAPYRETRFYRNVEGRWLRTAPDPAFWGVERTLETPHFHFKYYERDAEAVEALAAQAEALYAQLRTDAGLPPDLTTRPMTIEIVPRLDVTSWRFIGDVLTIPSPALLPVPVDHPDSDRLARSLVRPLSARVLGEALAQTSVRVGWYPLVEGMSRWASWQAGPLPSPWEMHLSDELRKLLANGHAPSLNILTGPAPYSVDRWIRAKAAETLIDFVVVTYGRERLPALLRGLSVHTSWDTLIPEVFGISRAEFEARWQRFILVIYGPPPADAASEARRYVRG